MATKKKMLQAAAGNAGGEALNVEDVFSTYLWTSDSSSSITVNNGIDLDGEGGMVWIKSRSNAVNHVIVDTERVSGTTDNYLMPNLTNAQTAHTNEFGSFTSTGFTVPYNIEAGYTNFQTREYASWTFRKAPKFFDVVTYTGTGSKRTVNHNLGSTPGMIIIKRTDSSGDNWDVWHRSLGSNGGLNNYYVQLNSTAATSLTSRFGIYGTDDPNDTTFTVKDQSGVNASGATYVAYLFAHNDGDGEFGADGDADIIKCGSYTGNGTAGHVIDLGFEAQWVMVKCTNSSESWIIYDVMRGMPVDGNGARIRANDNGIEESQPRIGAASQGFQLTSGDGECNFNNNTYIYMAIRRGTKVPESATEVFAVQSQAGGYQVNRFASSGFPVDFVLDKESDDPSNWLAYDRLRGGKADLKTNLTNAEATNSPAPIGFDYNDGITEGFYNSANTVILPMWKRAPGFFDAVAYSGNQTAGHNISHNLGAVPEMMWVKKRNGPADWRVYHSGIGATKYLTLSTAAASATHTTLWNDTAPTDSVFTLGTESSVNSSGDDFIAYLFASLDGISKVGSYTGNGGTQTIDCGFTSGARFLVIKNTEQGRGWVTIDTERGLAVGDDKVLYLNATNSQSDLDFVDPHSSGFTLSTSNDQVNATGKLYIFYAIA